MKIIKFCHYCGKRYYVDKSQEERSKFCSDYCFRKNKNTQMDYNCEFCGKMFKVIKSKYDKAMSGNKHLYCSTQCAKDVQKPKWNDILMLFEERGYILLSNEYINTKEKLEYICLKHEEYGSQYITYNNLKCGFGCKYCGIEKTANSKRLSFDKVREAFKKHDMILLDQEYKNANIPLMYICKHHQEIGVQYMALSNAYKQHCPYCNIVKGENSIASYLIKNNIQYTIHKTYDDLLGIKGGKLSYDFYLPFFNMLIEYQGEQHERPVEIFGGEEQFKTQQEHDNRKREYAKKNNIELLEIWYYDFKNIEKILSNRFLLIA